MKYVLLIFVGNSGSHKVVGPFETKLSAETWAMENIDARMYPWKVEDLIDPIGPCPV